MTLLRLCGEGYEGKGVGWEEGRDKQRHDASRSLVAETEFATVASDRRWPIGRLLPERDCWRLWLSTSSSNHHRPLKLPAPSRPKPRLERVLLLVSMSELTTSKINRQFRTLRSKCSALTSLTLAPSRPAVAVTYGSSSRSLARKSLDGDDAPPLAILQSLDKLGTRLHLDRAIVENMQLSRRIYEVRDAFKNIVQSTFGTPTEAAMVASRVMPLAGICARFVGEHIQSEIAASLDGDSNDENREDDIRSNVMDDLYEQVPSSYRK